MNTAKKLSGVALATMAAALFATTAAAPALADKHEAKVKCEGVNSCKGKGSCHSATNGCKGQNSCKGKGWLEMTKAECDGATAKAKAGGEKK